MSLTGLRPFASVLALGAFSLIGCAAPESTRTEPAERPNVLFISVDDLNDWITPLGGHPLARTPNLERLAREGVTFTRNYTASPGCNPSRTALLTGLHTYSTGMFRPWLAARREGALEEVCALGQRGENGADDESSPGRHARPPPGLSGREPRRARDVPGGPLPHPRRACRPARKRRIGWQQPGPASRGPDGPSGITRRSRPMTSSSSRSAPRTGAISATSTIARNCTTTGTTLRSGRAHPPSCFPSKEDHMPDLAGHPDYAEIKERLAILELPVLAGGACRNVLRFVFAGGTNLDPAKDIHVHNGEIRILDDDRIEAVWAVHGNGKKTGTNEFFLKRKEE